MLTTTTSYMLTTTTRADQSLRKSLPNALFHKRLEVYISNQSFFNSLFDCQQFFNWQTIYTFLHYSHIYRLLRSTDITVLFLCMPLLFMSSAKKGGAVSFEEIANGFGME